MPADKDKLKQELIRRLEAVTKDLRPEKVELPETLTLLPLTERPFFPPQTQPILMNERFWLESVKRINEKENGYCGLILSSENKVDQVKPQNLSLIGTVIRMHHPVCSKKKIQFIAEGLKRFSVVEWLSDKVPFRAKVSYPVDKLGSDIQKLKAYAITIINTLKDLMKHNPVYSEELKFFLNRFSASDPSPLADFAASLTQANKMELQSILDAVSLEDRLERVLFLVKKEVEMVKLQTKIRLNVENKLNEQQRKFFLKEQLKAIQKELGITKDDKTADIDRINKRLEELTLPKQAKKRIDDEMRKLSVLEPGSPEYAVTVNYLNTITGLPWGVYSDDNFNLRHAKLILNCHHEGLEDIKARIIEFLAVGQLKGDMSGSIILLVGPPGVGKTSIGRCIAQALGRAFYRFSVGGMRDEAEIKGHRRTYVGAQPGKIIQAIKECGTANPVLMLDEIDKMGASYQGDPASALLEVLDPEQNTNFLDHYLDVRFDISKVLFVCTANQLDTLSRPLLDRMEIMRLAGYITAEKINIAKNHLIAKQLDKAGLKKSQLKISSPALRALINNYAREAGVRNLEKCIAQITRKVAVKVVKNPKTKINITIADLPDYLGKAVYKEEKPNKGVGVITGLAWTAMGGATLNIEASVIHQRQASLKLTGKLGEVMRESADIAYSYVVSNQEHLNYPENFFDKRAIHLHVPEGATPKDGPSAGITMASALISMARGKAIRRRIAMTGELTLTGQVLAVGGIREKVIAGKRIGINELILPEACIGDYEDLPKHIRKGMTVHFVNHYSQVQEILVG